MYSEKKKSLKGAKKGESKGGHLVEEQKTNYKDSRYKNEGKIVEKYKEPGYKDRYRGQ